ncbi:MAG TPA: hypothetical protein VFD58_18755 [Blastocatellia bacterium]|nr:hypothetical protein [Blastocatellia bacterium]
MRNAVLSPLIILLVLPSAFRALPQSRKDVAKRAEFLRILRETDYRPYRVGYDESVAETGINLYRQGDKSLLKPLLRLGLNSDGALAEVLGDFYGDVSKKKPPCFYRPSHPFPQRNSENLPDMLYTLTGAGRLKE